MGDANLGRDDFFRGKIEEAKDGYIDLKLFLNCNNLKKMGIDNTDIIKETLADSSALELNDDNTMVRRVGNKKLPEYTKKKREVKAQAKELKKNDSKPEEQPEPVIRDEQGRIQFAEQDFENPRIINFATKEQDDQEYQCKW
jgi:glutaredoxin 2